MAQRPGAISRQQRLSTIQGCIAARHGEAQLRSIPVIAISHGSLALGRRGTGVSPAVLSRWPGICRTGAPLRGQRRQAREIVYDTELFEFDKSGVDPNLMR